MYAFLGCRFNTKQKLNAHIATQFLAAVGIDRTVVEAERYWDLGNVPGYSRSLFVKTVEEIQLREGGKK